MYPNQYSKQYTVLMCHEAFPMFDKVCLITTFDKKFAFPKFDKILPIKKFDEKYAFH